jgi:hypothetical protein
VAFNASGLGYRRATWILEMSAELNLSGMNIKATLDDTGNISFKSTSFTWGL